MGDWRESQGCWAESVGYIGGRLSLYLSLLSVFWRGGRRHVGRSERAGGCRLNSNHPTLKGGFQERKVPQLASQRPPCSAKVTEKDALARHLKQEEHKHKKRYSTICRGSTPVQSWHHHHTNPSSPDNMNNELCNVHPGL